MIRTQTPFFLDARVSVDPQSGQMGLIAKSSAAGGTSAFTLAD